MKLAINRNAINKVPVSDPHFGMITKTYMNVDVTQEAFAWAINQGFAFCAQHKNQRRASNNFTCAGFTAADIDHGLRLEEALQQEFVKQYASVAYTTPSHTDEIHRFRIVFETERDITDPKEMRDAYNGVIKKFGGDPSCTDPCRQFWGSKDSNPQVLGNILPNSVLEELITLGQETPRRDHTRKL